MKDVIAEIQGWFEQAVPEPTERTFWVQAGCDAEEYAEQLEAMGLEYYSDVVDGLADELKSHPENFSLTHVDRLKLLDALCDGIVTRIGKAHMLGFDILGALSEVNRSNWSKFVDGKPVFNAQGKIAKPESYSPPNLTPFLNRADKEQQA